MVGFGSGQFDNISEIEILPLKAGKGQPSRGTSWETLYLNRAGYDLTFYDLVTYLQMLMFEFPSMQINI